MNVYKPSSYTRVRLIKAFETRRRRPTSVVLGTSRSHLAFNPEYAPWKDQAAITYNVAFDGATTKEMYFFVRHLSALGPLTQVLLGLDTYHAAPTPAYTRPGFDATVLLEPGEPAPTLDTLWTSFKLFTSFDMLKASVSTVQSQEYPEPAWLAPNGQRLGEVFFRRRGEEFQEKSPRAYFEHTDEQAIGDQLEWRIPARTTTKPYFSAPGTSDTLTSLDYIQKIIDHCRERSIDLKIFITPSHAHQMEVATAAGGWAAIENGKRALVKMLADDERRHLGQTAIPLYDFSVYSDITTEDLPPQGSHAEMRYYWDSSHFKEAVGNMVLDRLLGRAPSNDFGRRLTLENIEDELQRNRLAQEKYREGHLEDISRIRALVTVYMREHGIRDEPGR